MLITGLIATAITTAQWLTAAKIVTATGIALTAIHPAVENMKAKKG